MPPSNILRRFVVKITEADTVTTYTEHVAAAYWQVGTDSVTSVTSVGRPAERDAFIVFKDTEGKPVFAVRGDRVETITEVREQPTATISTEPGISSAGAAIKVAA
jgi:hypothetical protein